MPQPNCQPIRYCWDADKVKTLIRLRAELSPLFTGKRNASKYAWTVVEKELNVPLPLSKIIKKWNNLLQEYKAIKLSEEPKRREWPFFTLMDVYFSDQVNDPTLRLFSSTKTFGSDTLDDSITFDDDFSVQSAIAAAAAAGAANLPGPIMDISDMMQENHSAKPEENDIERNNNNYGQQPDFEENHQEDNRSEVKQRPNEHQNIDQYLLSWNNFHGNMCKGFHNLQKDGQMVDVTIAAGGKIFKAHKLVLSVCSPYFQRIFIENPSTHPILFMTDVNSNYMSGLLDFMYSGQVNVKYDDLPSFLKVAEAMQIKGLHTESTTDLEDKDPPGNNNNNNNSSNNNNNNNTKSRNSTPSKARPTINQNSTPIRNAVNLNINKKEVPAKPQRATIPSQSAVIAAAAAVASLTDDIRNNNNNNISPKYAVQQANISGKLLDSNKYHKYYSKRKLLAQYEQEMRNEKRSKLNANIKEDANQNYKLNSEDMQNIKIEPDIEMTNEDLQAKMRHSILENSQNIVDTGINAGGGVGGRIALSS